LASCHKTQVMPSGPGIVSHTRFMLEEEGTFSVGNAPAGTALEIDFGDGSSESGVCGDSFVHSYTVPGDYTVVARIGANEEISKRVRVYSLLSLSSLMQRLAEKDNGEVLVMTHRAHSTDKNIPENSISAVNECIRLGVDFVEVDTHRTADGQIVICHDQTIDRTTNGSGDITKMNLADIKKFRLLDRNGKVTNESVPTLEELLKAARGKIYVNLDYSPRTASTSEVLGVVEKLDMVQGVLMYCNTEAKVNECIGIDDKVQCYPWVTQYGPLKGKGIYFVQLNNGASLGNAENDGFLCTVNMSSVVSGSTGDINGTAFVLDTQEVDDILTTYPKVKILHTDTPEELISYLETKGKRQ
ncbi:MAG: glycerophosphodiester phosphodiesterase, partial [Bacteroidales bacterium]|nr:glycerophosphodiester phosphodiesterase [Bacteroidales bacterium]